MPIQDQLLNIQNVIREQAGETPVTLVAVTKYATINQMREAYQAGIRHFGENKVQDTLVKMESFPSAEFPDLHWHLIGTLQSNKARKTVGQFELIHSVDSLALARTLSRHNEEAGLKQKILLQINISGDETRHGFDLETLSTDTEQVAALPGIDLRGLMAMAPPEISLAGDNAALKACFQKASGLKNDLQAKLGIDLPELSMGMSHDFPQALASGATIIRIGNYLFKT